MVTEIEWAKARPWSPDDYAAAASRTGGRPPLGLPRDGRRVPSATRTRSASQRPGRLRRPAAAVPARPARRPRVRPPSAGASGTSSSTSSRTSTRCSAQLLAAWLGDRDDLCVVGDPNQAIYAWNGADPTALTGFLDRYPGGEVVRLADNYRSTPQILAVANAVLAGGRADGAGPTRRRAALRANRPDGPAARSSGLRRRRRRGPGHRPLRPRPPRPGRALVVARRCSCRTNAQTALIEQALHEAGIPFRVRGSGSLLDQPEVQGGPPRPARSTGRLRRGASPTSTSPSARRRRPGAGDADGDARRRRPSRVADARRRPGRQPGRRSSGWPATSPPSTPARRPPGFVAWLHDTTAGRPARPVTATPSRSPRSTRPRASSGRSSTSPGSSRASCRSATPRTPTALAEERRLFYVAVTRAERELHLHVGRAPHVRRPRVAARPLALPRRGRGRLPGARAGDVPADWTTYLAAHAPRCATSPARRPQPAGAPLGRRRGDARSATTAAARGASDLDAVGLATFDALKAWRTHQARAAAVPPYVIFHDRVLRRGRRPTARAPATDLLAVPGIGEVKVNRFGDADPRHRRRARRHPDRMRLPRRAALRPSPADRLLALFTDPDFYPTLARAAADRRPRGRATTRRRGDTVAHQPAPALHRRPAAAPRWPFIDPAKLTLGRGARSSTSTGAAATTRAAPRPLRRPAARCQGVYVFTEPTGGGTHPAPRGRPQGAGAAGRRPGRAGARVGPAGARRRGTRT